MADGVTPKVGEMWMIYGKHKKSRQMHPFAGDGFSRKKIHGIMYYLDTPEKIDLFRKQIKQLRDDNREYVFEGRKQR